MTALRAATSLATASFDESPANSTHTVATVTGPLTCTWEGDGGFAHEHVASLQVV